MKCRDHKGKEFNSIVDMCSYYKINRTTYIERRKRGLSTKESLDSKVRPSFRVPIVDNFNNKFNSIYDFCKHYNRNTGSYYYYLSKGYNIKQMSIIFSDRKKALEFRKLMEKENYKVTNSKSIEFEGNKYNSIKDLCNVFGVKLFTFYSRHYRGWNLHDCIYGNGISTKHTKREPIIYNGIIYKNFKSLCKSYGVSYNAFISRRSRGHSLEKCMQAKKITEKE